MADLEPFWLSNSLFSIQLVLSAKPWFGQIMNQEKWNSEDLPWPFEYNRFRFYMKSESVQFANLKLKLIDCVGKQTFKMKNSYNWLQYSDS